MEHIQVQIHKPFTITLFARPQNGYMWHLDDAGGVDFVKETRKHVHHVVLVGQAFTFISNLTGTSTIRFVYKRSWETCHRHIKIVNVDAVIENRSTSSVFEFH